MMRMRKIIFATGNAGKMKEIRMILDGLAIDGMPAEILSMKEAGLDISIVEDGKSFTENAVIKARAVAEAAKKAGSELYRTDLSRISDVYCSVGGTDFCFRGFGRMHIRLTGTYQLYNAANVLTAVEVLRKRGMDITDDDVRAGLEEAKWHGRFEVLKNDPLVIFDGSHNPDGINCAAESIRLCSEKKVALLIGVMADKEYSLYADMLGDLTDKAFAVTPDNPRALDSRLLADSFNAKGIPAIYFTKFEEGVIAAYEYAKKQNIPLIALGSLYMYREFIKVIENLPG